MDTGFDPLLHEVRNAFPRLLEVTPVAVDVKPSPIPEEPGVYVFYADGKPLRVGTAQDLRKRVRKHHTGNHQNAAFAKRLAREETRIKGSYQEGWDEQVEKHPQLGKAFEEAKEKIRTMSLAWLEVPEADCRYLLEFYAAKELQTPYNDFKET